VNKSLAVGMNVGYPLVLLENGVGEGNFEIQTLKGERANCLNGNEGLGRQGSGFLIHGSSSGVEYEDGFGNYNGDGDGDGSMFTVEDKLGGGKLEGSNSKEVQVMIE
jgi:hypothetical protein